MITTGTTTHMTQAEAQQALILLLASPNVVMCYAKGNIAMDTSASRCNSNELNGLRMFMWTACQRGHIHLVQKRLEFGRFEYIARKRTRP